MDIQEIILKPVDKVTPHFPECEEHRDQTEKRHYQAKNKAFPRKYGIKNRCSNYLDHMIERVELNKCGIHGCAIGLPYNRRHENGQLKAINYNLPYVAVA